jgi:hypothetical protein
VRILLVLLIVTSIACHSKKKLAAISSQPPIAKAESPVVIAPPTPAKAPPPPPSPIDCGNAVSFAALKPLLSKSCTNKGCHDANADALNFTKYENFVKFSQNGEIKQHVLIQKNMPPSSTLSEAELLEIKCWLASEMKQE